MLLCYKDYFDFTELASHSIQCRFFKFPVLMNMGEISLIKYTLYTKGKEIIPSSK